MCFCKIFLWSYPFFTIGTPDNLCLLLNMCPAFFLFFHGTRRASLIVALGADEAVLYARASEGVDAVPVGSPGEDLGPLDLRGPLQVVVGDQHDGVVGGVGDCETLHRSAVCAPDVDGA